MNDKITNSQFDELIRRQGIAKPTEILPYADFRQHLRYRTGNLHELARLIDRQFGIRLTAGQIETLTTLRKTVSLLNRLRQKSALPHALPAT